jgi:hypothetical protein
MPPEERVDAHEQWLLDHDRAIAELRQLLTESADIHRRIVELLRRWRDTEHEEAFRR